MLLRFNQIVQAAGRVFTHRSQTWLQTEIKNKSSQIAP